MSDPTDNRTADAEGVSPQPLRDGDTSIQPNDPAQAEWDLTTALDEGADLDEGNEATATGDDPAQIPSDDDQIPAEDLITDLEQPDTQGGSPLEAELGEDGQGDVSPGDL